MHQTRMVGVFAGDVGDFLQQAVAQGEEAVVFYMQAVLACLRRWHGRQVGLVARVGQVVDPGVGALDDHPGDNSVMARARPAIDKLAELLAADGFQTAISMTLSFPDTAIF